VAGSAGLPAPPLDRRSACGDPALIGVRVAVRVVVVVGIDTKQGIFPRIFQPPLFPSKRDRKRTARPHFSRANKRRRKTIKQKAASHRGFVNSLIFATILWGAFHRGAFIVGGPGPPIRQAFMLSVFQNYYLSNIL